MVAVDTNVLLRLILDDHDAQSRAAHALFRTHAPLFVSHVVLAEAVWVLREIYEKSRAQIDETVARLLDAEGLVIQDLETVYSALESYRTSSADFSDCLILAIAARAGASSLVTFDEKLARLPGARRLGTKRKRS